jgi:crossover junction endodeoxyribonuclease RuvC
MNRILGIDPGLASTGYGIIDADGNRFAHVADGVIETGPGSTLGDRLLALSRALERILDQYRPSEAGIERLYFGRNTTTAIPVAEARGVVLCALASRGIPCHEYPPATVKQAVVGSGRAEKDQVQEMVRLIFRLRDRPASSHAADALAVAFCHSTHSRLGRLIDSKVRESTHVQQPER